MRSSGLCLLGWLEKALSHPLPRVKKEGKGGEGRREEERGRQGGRKLIGGGGGKGGWKGGGRDAESPDLLS